MQTMFKKMLIVALASFASSGAWADGIDTAANVDLPISASSTKAMIVGGGERVAKGNVEFLGNVGVGKASPAYAVDVAGTVNAQKILVNGHAISLSTRVVTSTVAGWRWPVATATCADGELVTGGGGSCRCPPCDTSEGYNFVYASEPSGNGWSIWCDTPLGHTETAVAYAICSKISQ